MKKVITYGTFDLLHYGHYFLLKRAKALGDYLIVGVSTDEMYRQKGKSCVLSQEVRRQMVADLAFVDEVIYEETMQQKVKDVIDYDVDIFCLGDDYRTVFPQMPEYDSVSKKCDVVFLERTPDVSTSVLKDKLREKLFCTKSAESVSEKEA